MRGEAVPGGGPESGGARALGGARDAILARVREALIARERPEHPGALPFPDPVEGVVQAFTARFEASGGEVVFLEGEEAVRGWLDRFVAEFGRMAAGRDLPELLRPGLPHAEPAAADLGVSMARWAAADTGSLVLDSREGRRSQLLPPVHLVWVRRQRIVATLADALERAAVEELPAVLALHSGPSKSADIGRILVTGIHGPGRVVAAVLDDAPGA